MSIVNSITFNSINPNFQLNPVIYNAEAFGVSNFVGVNSVYVIDQRNNNFSFIESNSTTVTRIAVIPSGNYTLTSYLTAISSSMTTAGTATYTATNNDLTNRITITSNGVTFILVDTLNNSYYESGFTVLNPSFSATQTASTTYDLSGLKMINIVSPSFGYSTNLVCGINKNVIASIPVTNPYLGIISYSPSVNFISSQVSSISNLDVQFFDELFRPITLDKSYSLTILFRIE